MRRTRCPENDCDRHGEGGGGVGVHAGDEERGECKRCVVARTAAGRTRCPLAATTGTRIALELE